MNSSNLSNETASFSNFSNPDSDDPIEDFFKVFLPTICSTGFIVGLIGNGLVVCVLVKYNKTSNMSDLCLLNLAISDLLFVFSLPFFAHYEANLMWTLGSFMCNVMIALYMLGFHGNIFFMILMTVDRYVVIVHAHTYSRLHHRSFINRVGLVGFMWTLTLGASLPYIIFSQVIKEFCYVNYSQLAWELVSYMQLIILGLILPLSVMVFCYSRVIRILMAMKSQKKHKAVRLIVILVTAFFIFCSPFYITMFLMILSYIYPLNISERHLYIAYCFAHIIVLIHCCVNPIIYAFVGQKFRNLVLKLLKDWFPFCFGRCTRSER